MEKKGMEALDGAKEKAGEKKPEEKSASKKGGKGKSKKLPKRIITTRLDDGTYHHEHEMEGKNGMTDFHRPEYSSANADDAGDHVAQHMGGGDGEEDQGDDGEEDQEAAQAEAQQPAAAAAPAVGM